MSFQPRPKQLYATSMVAKPQPIRPSISAITATNTTITTTNVAMNRHGVNSSSGRNSSAGMLSSGNSSPVSGSSPGPPSISSSITKKDIKGKPKSQGVVTTDGLENEDHEDDANEEVKFLFNLFVPNKKSRIKSITPLLNNLPRIIPNPTNQNHELQINDLNFQVHLFLSTIMLKYVNSWYLTKLNTNNLEFVNLLYQIMGNFVYDFSKRINEIIQQDNKCLELINEIADIVNNHLNELVSEPNSEYSYKVVNDHYQQSKSKNCFKYNLDVQPEEIISDYLQGEHIIFEQDTQTYFRVLFKQILQATFESDEYSPNPLTSEISTDLTILLMSDLVLDKLFDKLATPEFILGTVINTIVTKLTQITQPENKIPQEGKVSWDTRLKQGLNSTYQKISDFIVNISYETKNIIHTTIVEQTTFNVFDNSIVKLIDTITNFSHRKPLVVNFFKFITSWLQINDRLNIKVNSILSRYIANKIKTSLTEDRISGIISDLRIKLFYNQDTSESEETLTINEIVDNFIQLYDKLPGFQFDKESEEDRRELIKRVLSVFNSVNIDDDIAQTSTKMNKLLVIELLDCIIANLYPELARD
ncbi:hypothetical protein JA1_001792 [Spathaspora sp. JA1]|nr:hypothetical protein JA1_001792 [Spathaspora sp. JA1]